MRRLKGQRYIRQSGQAMAEYTVVLFFGIMALTAGDPSPVERLASVIQENWRGYSYAMSLSELPNVTAENQTNTGKAYDQSGMLSSLSQHIGNPVDHCKKMPKIRPERELKNGPLGFGGAIAPVGRCAP